MTIKPLVIFPDSLLRQVSKPVEKIDAEFRKLVDDMLETMYAAPGIGLAAVQVGVLYRFFVMDIEKGNKLKNPMVFINPEIISLSDKRSVYEEGCLSIPEYSANVERPAYLTIKYFNYAAQQQIIYADGLMATCIQHEMDHLNGVLFIDHISRLKREMVMRRFAKLAKHKT
ncbi:Peptide deformylase [Liberibacter crescens BT-1]|uniref:Peptide deformylase n=1 Tax=Liberibacter crescens (strain BT-1) TaxID=1215343 RepID=L0EUU6_LIBCB|nr:peptide deformylase [Liberibacter crescens]AGA65324.1 Peptide deformylase [Liberibacter crescens BT-1]AMC13253.1 peptide deformylase [Liberibacter crescens]